MSDEDDNNDAIIHHYKPDAFTKWLLGLCASFLLAGVVAIWNMSNQLSALDERIANWIVTFQGQITSLTSADLQMRQEHSKLRDRLREDEQQIFRNGARLDNLERNAR